ncbi:hypothetical protein SAMN05216266_10727 [Amycolatopsis marina]|uniref:Uncharacterized protein n=1 Tax=Amycolatopsis marina TaxID=490629 RepID=A0A1I0ZIT2_9PSEU|nr:hypothetical protein [Amycolatopsis marina]SFB25431.1 hypothetical protein SAMN05216266_10727 [Amycolatopsis marina]
MIRDSSSTDTTGAVGLSETPFSAGDLVPAGGGPGKPWRLVVISGLAGLLLAVIWSPYLVDKVIAGAITGPVLGADANEVAITGSGMAMGFAVITGIAGMFTACNIAVFCALAPMSGDRAKGTRTRTSLLALARPVGWLMLGAVGVAGAYGVLGVLVGPSMPQVSGARIGDPETGLAVRILQAGIVFGLIGLVMLWRGLAYAGLVRNPLERVFQRRSWAETLFLGCLIGAFLIGRPWPPFRRLFEYAVSTDNILLGFLTFALQSIGNILGVAVLFLLVMLATRGRFQRWLFRVPGRAARFSAVAFIVVGTFFVAYWSVKLGYRAGVMWWPTMPYNS